MAAGISKLTSLKAFWFVVCFAGNIYQIAQITELYMSYRISTSVTVDFPKEFIAPSISFCFYAVDIVNWDKLFAIKPQLRSNMDKNISSLEDRVRKMGHVEKMYFDRDVFANMTGAEIYSVLLDESDLFLNCGTVSNLVYQISVAQCKDKFKIRKFYLQLYVCFTLEKIKEPKWSSTTYDQMDLDRVTGIPGYLYEFKLKKKALKRADMVTIVMSHPPETNRGDQKKIFITRLLQAFSATYSDFENFFLPAPFSTGCIDYNSSTPYYSRADCYDRCVTEFSLNQINKIYAGPIVYPDTKQQIIPTRILMENQSLIELKIKASKICSHKCRFKECNQHFYVPKLKSSADYIYNTFILYAMSDPKITTVCSPRMDLMMYLTDMASTIGFWIGTSIFTSIFEMVSLFMELKHLFTQNPIGKRENKSSNQLLYSFIEKTIKAEIASKMATGLNVHDSHDQLQKSIHFSKRKLQQPNDMHRYVIRSQN